MNNYLYLKIRQLLTGFLLVITLTGCNNPDVRVGTVSGPETDLMKHVKTIALQDYRLRIKVVEFSDYRLLNTALNDGGIDANIFQHRPYLKEELKHTQYPLKVIGETFIYPMGVYSYHFTHLRDIPKQAVVGIPQDPTNQARALRLLEKAGLIKLDIDAGDLATPKAIRYNPKELQFRRLEASKLGRALNKNIDVAVMNMNYAMLAELSPSQNALFKEKAQEKYTNLIVVRKVDENRPEFEQLLKAYQDEEVLAYAKELLEGQASPASSWRRGRDSNPR